MYLSYVFLALVNRHHKYLQMFGVHFKNTLVILCGKLLSMFVQLSCDINLRNLGFTLSKDLFYKIYKLIINAIITFYKL